MANTTMASRASTTSRAVGMVRVQQHEEHHSPLRLQPEHPLLTKEGETAVEGHHHPTEHVLQHPTELHNHLQLNIEREEKRQNLKYLKIKTQLRVAQVTYLPQHYKRALQGNCVCFKKVSMVFNRSLKGCFKQVSRSFPAVNIL